MQKFGVLTMTKVLRSNQGFTLIEALVALFILTVGIMSLYSMQTSAITGNYMAHRTTLGSAWAANQIEKIMTKKLRELPAIFNGAPYIANCGGVLPANRQAIDNYHDARTPSLDRNDDGRALTEDVANKNGFDDENVDAIPNFGLDNATTATADCWEATPDNRFNIFYNFAIDIPFPRTVTIKIIVQELNTTAAPVTFTYIKDDII